MTKTIVSLREASDDGGNKSSGNGKEEAMVCNVAEAKECGVSQCSVVADQQQRPPTTTKYCYRRCLTEKNSRWQTKINKLVDRDKLHRKLRNMGNSTDTEMRQKSSDRCRHGLYNQMSEQMTK